MEDDVDRKLGMSAEKLIFLREQVAILQLQLALKRFNPSQPRWPAGRSDGGRWRPEAGTGALLALIRMPAKQPADETLAQQEGIYDPARMPMCLAQQALDHELCRMAKSGRCWESADIRYDNCMKNVYIPPLEVGR